MKTLFGRSVGLSGDIIIFTLLEWALFVGFVFGVHHLMITNFEDEVLDFLMPIMRPLLVPAVIAMSLSQMRTALLRLHQTSALDFSRIYSYVFALVRFFAAVLPLVLLAMIALLAVMYFKGLFTIDELMFIFSTFQNGEPEIAIALFTSGPRFIYLCLMIFILMISFSFIMIPMAASAAAAGENSDYYDPFYGFAQQAVPLVNVTVLVLALTAGLLYADVQLFILLNEVFRPVGGGELPQLESMILTYGPLVVAFLALVWTSTIWYSAAVLAFIDYREEIADRQFKRQQAHFGDTRDMIAHF